MSGRMSEKQKAAARAICAAMGEGERAALGNSAHAWSERAPYDRMVRAARGKWRIIVAADRLRRLRDAGAAR